MAVDDVHDDVKQMWCIMVAVGERSVAAKFRPCTVSMALPV
jgi:hypothetical protein